MRAVTMTRPGGPEVLDWTEVPDPRPAAGEVVLEVAASAVNRADLMQREGRYPPPPGAPDYLGLECSGHVVAVAPDVEGWAIGDSACALLAGGGYAQRVAVAAGHLLPVPAGVDVVSAAALPEAAATVWSNLFMLAGLRPAELLLVHGGASGIGNMAIQLAKALGARVAVTAGSASKLDRCRELGADIMISYRDEDFVARVQEASEGRGADVVLDVMGASYLARNIAALAPNGRLVVIGLQGGARAELDLAALMAKRAALLATTLRARPAAEKAAIVASVREHVWPLVEAGAVRPIVDRVLPITEVREAHRVVEDGEHVGKVLLLM